MKMLDFQLTPSGLKAIGRNTNYHILLTPTGVYLVAKAGVGLALTILTPKGNKEDCIGECMRVARRWENETVER